jgi:hypothetical protein
VETNSESQWLARAFRTIAQIALIEPSNAVELTTERKNALIEAQRNWIKFRDTNCGFYADPEGGSAARLTAHECILNATAQRAKELRLLTTLRNQPLVVFVEQGILAYRFSKYAIDHLNGNPIGFFKAGRIFLCHFRIGRRDWQGAQKKALRRSTWLFLSMLSSRVPSDDHLL